MAPRSAPLPLLLAFLAATTSHAAVISGQASTVCDGSQVTRAVGYYASWSSEREADCNPAPPSVIDCSKFSHLIFAFAAVTPTYQLTFSSTQQQSLARDFVAQRSRCPRTRFNIAFGGWSVSQGSSIFPEIAASAQSRRIFIDSVLSFLVSNGFNGLDIDWEFPETLQQKADLTTLVTELYARMRPASLDLSMATPAGSWSGQWFDLLALSKNVDFFNVMAYDFSGTWDSAARPHTGIIDTMDGINYYKSAGVDPKKLNLGLAWYGHTFRLTSPTCQGYNCPFSGGGAPGRCTLDSGTMSNFEIEAQIAAENIRPTLDVSSQTMFYVFQNSLVTYDNPATWTAKLDLAKRACLGGAMVWSVDQVTPTSIVVLPSLVPASTPSLLATKSVAPASVSPAASVTSSPSRSASPSVTSSPAGTVSASPSASPSATPSPSKPTAPSPTGSPSSSAQENPCPTLTVGSYFCRGSQMYVCLRSGSSTLAADCGSQSCVEYTLGTRRSRTIQSAYCA